MRTSCRPRKPELGGTKKLFAFTQERHWSWRTELLLDGSYALVLAASGGKLPLTRTGSGDAVAGVT